MHPPGHRERKAARTRLALLDALLARLPYRSLEDISARELADEAGISEASFFNYFATKSALVAYFIQLWALEAAWHARAAGREGPRAALEAVLRLTARQVAPCPRVMAEVTVFQARLTGTAPLRRVELAERQQRFPTLEGIEALEAQGFDEVVLPLLERAVEEGVLPARTDVPLALLGLASIFFGVPLLLGPRAPAQIEPAYVAELDIFWRGLGADPKPRRRS